MYTYSSILRSWQGPNLRGQSPLEFTTSPDGGWVVGWVLDFMRLMLISTQVEVVVEVGVELGNSTNQPELSSGCLSSRFFLLLNNGFKRKFSEKIRIVFSSSFC